MDELAKLTPETPITLGFRGLYRTTVDGQNIQTLQHALC